MHLLRTPRRIAFVFMALVFLHVFSLRGDAQAALLMEEPYGFFGTVNPTGHTAIYFARVCAETPTKLRRCQAGELGSVISRYSGMNHYDWIAIPLIPYLYSVQTPDEVPVRVDHAMVDKLRDQYHEAHLMSLGTAVRRGGFWHGGWTQLIGVAYERRMYAFRFNTTEAQDDAFIERMNSGRNHSNFQLLFNNCADFSRSVLNQYFPRTFRRSFFPDAGMTTPKQITYKLVRYSRKHPETQLQVFEIPQVPGYRRSSRTNKSIAESLVTTGYAIPIAAVNPFLAGGLFVDYVVRGRYHLVPKDPERLNPDSLATLTAAPGPTENALSASVQASSAADASSTSQEPTSAPANSDLKESTATHE